MWVATQDLPRSAAHPFYARLNLILDQHDFDQFVEGSIETLIEAAEQVETVRPDGEGIEEVVGDKGYHSNQSLVDLEAVGVRSYISEPDRGRRNWKTNPTARDAVYRNRRRIHRARGLRLLRLRGDRLERPFAHLFETGGMRRVYLRGHTEGSRPRPRRSDRAHHAPARDGTASDASLAFRAAPTRSSDRAPLNASLTVSTTGC